MIRRASTFRARYRKRQITSDDAVSNGVKYTLFFFNLFFWLAGLVLLFVGVYARLLQNDWNSVAGWSTDPAILMIVTGSIIFFVSFSGCVGSLRENILLLKVFAYSLGLIFLLEVIAGILAFALQGKVKDTTQEKMLEAIEQYHLKNKQTDLDDAVETIQIRFSCCGATYPRDWLNNVYYNCSREGYSEILTACGVPPSCCRKNAKTDTQCGYKVFAYPGMTDAERKKAPRINNATSIMWTGGCTEAVFDWVKENYFLLGGFALGVLVVQIVGICLALNMIDQLKFILEHI